MRIHLTINERTLRRTFKEQQTRTRRLTVFDKDLRGFGFKVAADGTRTFFVRTVRKLGTAEVSLGTAGQITAAEAREKAGAEIEAARTDRENGPCSRTSPTSSCADRRGAGSPPRGTATAACCAPTSCPSSAPCGSAAELHRICALLGRR